jgi:hypothetical protein
MRRRRLSSLRMLTSNSPTGRWVDMKRTGAWWEMVANWFAGQCLFLTSYSVILMMRLDTAMNSPLCEKARKQHDRQEGRTIIRLDKVISSAHQVIVDGSPGTGNYYEAWPLLTYLHNNPDKFEGLGPTTLRDMFSKATPGL